MTPYGDRTSPAVICDVILHVHHDDDGVQRTHDVKDACSPAPIVARWRMWHWIQCDGERHDRNYWCVVQDARRTRLAELLAQLERAAPVGAWDELMLAEIDVRRGGE